MWEGWWAPLYEELKLHVPWGWIALRKDLEMREFTLEGCNWGPGQLYPLNCKGFSAL